MELKIVKDLEDDSPIKNGCLFLSEFEYRIIWLC